MKYEKELEFAKRIVADAYSALCDESFSVREKGRYDLVTDLDLDIERFMTRAVREAFPDDDVLGEELSNKELTNRRTWIIDPIDGTVNMAHGLPIFGVQCALVEDKKPVVCAIYHPKTGELFWASENGAFRDGALIRASFSKPLDEVVLSFADFPHRYPDIAARELKAFERIGDKVAKIRLLGASCYDFAFTACGKTDGTVILTKNVWDIAPGMLLCEKAGCLISDLDGEPFEFGKCGLAACSTKEIQTLIIDGFSTKAL